MISEWQEQRTSVKIAGKVAYLGRGDQSAMSRKKIGKL